MSLPLKVTHFELSRGSTAAKPFRVGLMNRVIDRDHPQASGLEYDFSEEQLRNIVDAFTRALELHKAGKWPVRS